MTIIKHYTLKISGYALLLGEVGRKGKQFLLMQNIDSRVLRKCIKLAFKVRIVFVPSFE